MIVLQATDDVKPTARRRQGNKRYSLIDSDAIDCGSLRAYSGTQAKTKDDDYRFICPYCSQPIHKDIRLHISECPNRHW